jgi:ubiquinone/menaquinone biosynthesis C-methylase UbiE
MYRSKILPRLMHTVMSSDENDAIRARVCSPLSGTVVEVGFGSGSNVVHYPAAVRTVYAVEPATKSMELAADRIAASRAEVVHSGVTAERIDLPDGCADAVLSTWTLCTIPDAAAALREIARLLKPGAALHFVEHGVSPDARLAQRQRRIEPFTKPLFGGCHLTRDIPALLARSGFEVDELVTYAHPKEPKPFGWTFEGRAVASAPA